MADVIDISTKMKNPTEDYRKRINKCYGNIIRDGHCSCKVCNLKDDLAKEVIIDVITKCEKYDGQDGREALYGGDVMEILVTASKQFYQYLDDLDENE